MYPKVKFQISVKKDIDTLLAFTKDANFDGGENLNWAIFRKYPELKKYYNNNKITNQKELEKFIKEKYKKEKEMIEKNLEVYEKNWRKIENKFFDLSGEFFDEKYWTKGKYTAFPTIWGMFPRFLGDKTFQVPYKYRKKKYVNVVIAHEMLHFAFYEYISNKYPKYKTDSFLIWNTSEIFNEVVQNSPKWLKIFGVKTMGYPMHEKIVKKLKKKYHKQEDINRDELIKNILKEAESIKM
ncbi:hypothetical protein KKG48_01355 [Patescibacteria group bacterium]|nr:hypothetical protein [Patescibacteria group bacterium]MCG2694509.1 hypothetical protein [Candidatus Parcubacteria bacterium]